MMNSSHVLGFLSGGRGGVRLLRHAALSTHLESEAAVSPSHVPESPLHYPDWMHSGIGTDPAARAISANMWCVAILTSIFFAVYFLFGILSAVNRRLEVNNSDTRRFWTTCEAGLAEVCGGLTHVPMFCIVMICAELRSMQLQRLVGHSHEWVNVCMYIGTSVLVLQLAIDFVLGGLGAHLASAQSRALVAVRSVTSAVVHAVVAAIIAYIILLKAQADGVPKSLPPAMSCVVALAGFNFVACGLVEATCVRTGAAVKRYQQKPKWDWQREAAPLELPAMLGLLLVGITLRSILLNVDVQSWAIAGMVICTAAVIADAAIQGTSVICTLVLNMPPLREASGTVGRTVGLCDFIIFVFLCFGIITTVASVFTMEPQPFHTVFPNDSFYLRGVTLLGVIYFVFRTTLLALGGPLSPLPEWSVYVSASVRGGSLVLAPMFCVLMIAVRLRSAVLMIQNPQSWAQAAMCTGTFAIVVQLACIVVSCVLYGIPEELSKEAQKDRKPISPGSIRIKALISALVLLYLASATLLASVCALVIAVFSG